MGRNGFRLKQGLRVSRSHVSPIAVCERLITLPNTVSLVEFELPLTIGNIHAAEFPHLCCHHYEIGIANEKVARSPMPRPAACTGSGRDAKRHVAKMRLDSHSREECSRRSLSPTYLTVRGKSLDARIASERPEDRPRCLRRLVQVRSTHKLIRKGVCDEIKLRPGRTNLEPIAR